MKGVGWDVLSVCLGGVSVVSVGGRGGGVVCANFHFSLSAYVKMLSLSPSQVSPLQMAKLSGATGPGRGRGQPGGCRGGRCLGRGSLGRFPFLNKRNFVVGSPDDHCSPTAMFPNFLCPSSSPPPPPSSFPPPPNPPLSSFSSCFYSNSNFLLPSELLCDLKQHLLY